MGHVMLGELPRTRQWDQVVGLIAENADLSDVAAATLKAAESWLRAVANDDGLVISVWLLTQLPLAARESDYLDRLVKAGLTLDSPPRLLDLVGAFTDAVDSQMLRKGERSDIGEMAQMAAVETLTVVLGQRTSQLFGTNPDDIKRELGGLGTKTQFGILARDFFARLTRRFLTAFLSRELSNHVGGNRRFATLTQHTEFNEALDLHCRQAARIVEDFAGAWFSKAHTGGAAITQRKARGFANYAMEKMRAELLRGGGGSAGGSQ